MLCPAAVSAAAAAVWLLAVLGPGLSLPTEDNSEPGFTLCSHCFFRQTPPQGASAGLLLRPLCHTLPGGQAFATLSRPTCDTAVYSAFHLSHGWKEREGEEGEELVKGDEDGITVAVPALLRRGGDPSHPVSPSDSPVQLWDSTVTTLVQSSITPQCSTLGGDLYILTGAGRLGAVEDGDEECQMKPLWSAVCCAVPEGKGGFSMGIIRETGEEDRQLSVKELEEILGVAELFSEGCGGTDEGAVAFTLNLHNEVPVLPENVEEAEGDATGEKTGTTDVDSGTTDQDTNEAIQESREASITEEQVAANTQAEKTDDTDVTQGTSSDATSSDTWHDEEHSGATRLESPQSSGDFETVDEQKTDTNTTSTLFYILSTTMSIFKAPLRPIFSKITQLPEQVTYILQEDLGVLSALPGDTFNLFHLLTSDIVSWMQSAVETLFGIGDGCFSRAYYCTSSMMGALLDSCYTGVTGMGTLAGDTVGIFGDVLDNAWWVTKPFFRQLWEQSGGYVGTVVSEMGGQAQAVGGGLGRLVWRSGNGVFNVFKLGGGAILGMVDVIFGAVREAFGEESE